MRLVLWRARQRPFLRRAPRCLLSPAILAALVFIGCSESPSYVKPGPLFTAAEKAPSLQGQVYFYWPAEEQSRWNELLVMSCEGAVERVQPGGYARILVSPGRQCFKAEGVWAMESINSTASLEVAILDLNVEAGQTHFVRLEKGRGLLSSGMALRPVEPARAEPEIKRCGQMIPMTEDEMLRAWPARESG